MEAITPRQLLAEQLAAFIRKHGGHPINLLPLGHSDHLRFEVCLSDSTLVNRLQRFGFDLRLLSYSKRLDPWASTEIIQIGNPQQLHQNPAVIDICIYEVELPIVHQTQK
jgi:hypothetical protein